MSRSRADGECTLALVASSINPYRLRNDPLIPSPGHDPLQPYLQLGVAADQVSQLGIRILRRCGRSTSPPREHRAGVLRCVFTNSAKRWLRSLLGDAGSSEPFAMTTLRLPNVGVVCAGLDQRHANAQRMHLDAQRLAPALQRELRRAVSCSAADDSRPSMEET